MLNADRLCPGCMNDNGGEQVCSICGYDSTVLNDADTLPISFMLSERYLLGRVISRCGESVVYIAWDNSADVSVFIKEYYPEDVAMRNPDKTISVIDGMEFHFNEGLMEFLDINRRLANTDLPSVSKSINVFEENGTAYCVTAAQQGITLEDFLGKNGGSLRWEQARPLFLPLIDTVAGLHEMGIYHGGISPESIYVGRDGKLRLTEICGNTIRFSGVMENNAGYSAAEQYGFEDLSEGAYTDVYALSAVLFRVLIGTPPPSAEQRLNSDTLTIPAKFADELPRQVLVAIANGLQVLPKQRTASIDTFRNELVYGETQENARRAAASKNAEQAAVSDKSSAKKKKGSGAKYAVVSAVCTALVFAIIAGVLCLTLFKDQIFPNPDDLTSDVDSFVAPSVPSIGDVDEGAGPSAILYPVPELLGKYYSQIVDNEEYERFEVVIKDKEFSTKYPKGTVCAQSISAGTAVEKDTKIEVVISLGTQEVKVANVLGLDENLAKIELLKQGFLYENIEVVEVYDPDSKPLVVSEQLPKHGTSVSVDGVVRICVNKYEGEEDTSSSSSTTSSKNNSSSTRR